ncbi:TonB-dependent receptor domain-containing protein [Phenylobacterium sp.]|uniref:TonB-dependent receptor domain-containing protein n=1 Tax=Phenylobacterium sp. TaxID=1871053 RepID=UPI002CABE904|nr:TonB-dependent receptor [Phenylobacterium sp.]HVI31986.1 TonB-dependent receptor [Phenylobacterium sp.]
MRPVCVALAAPALLLAGQAAAQGPAPPTKPPAAAKPEPKTVGEVVVSGAAQDVRTSIDRTSYDVAKDLQSVTGSIGDALRNVPSVEVDVQGNVSLRGDPNVTIMIDGKPSGMFRGEGRAAALQNLPADQIERVEVITNPTAAFNPERAAGVINLVTKKTRKAGWSGSVRAMRGSEGRANGGLSGGFNSRKLTLSGDVSFRSDPQKYNFVEERERLDPASGALAKSRDGTAQIGEGRIWNLRGSADYDPDPANRIGVEVRRFDMKIGLDMYQHYEGLDAGGSPVRVFDRFGRSDPRRINTEGSVSWRRKFTGEDHELVTHLSREETEVDGGGRRGFISGRLPPAPDLFEDYRQDNLLAETELKIDYTRPMPAEGKLKAGYALERDDNRYDDRGSRGPSSDALVLEPALTNLFRFEQAIQAAYVTYEQPFGDLTLLGGLRLEQVEIDVDQVTQDVRASQDYVRLYPSLHASWRLSDARRLSASYSRRVQRPSAFELNPFLQFIDPFNYWQGNPFLKPQVTDSFEAAFQHRDGGTLYLATVYWRQSRDGVTEVVRDLGGGVLLRTRENLGESRAAGLELVANGKLTNRLSYNLSGNVSWNEIEASRLGFPEPRDGVSVGGRGNLNWQVTPKDFIQLNGHMNGERLTPQGYRKPFGMLNLGYRRKLNDRLSLMVTGQDLLSTFKDVQVLDTPALRSRVVRKGNVRGVFVGFNWTFGGQGQKPREPAFEFGGPSD